MPSDGSYRIGLEIVCVEHIIRPPVWQRIEAVHLQRVRVGIGDDRIWNLRSLVQIGADLRHVEGIEDLGGHWLSGGITNESLAEITDSLESRRHSSEISVTTVMHQVVVAAEEEQLVLEDGAADRAAELVHFESRPGNPVRIIESIVRI